MKKATFLVLPLLLDAACSRKIEGDPEKASIHSKSCALKEYCKASDYGVLVEGRFLKFDEAGDKLALEFLEKTKKNPLALLVTADFSVNPIAVSNLEEISREGSGPLRF